VAENLKAENYTYKDSAIAPAHRVVK
jgi:hypothetical protein